MKKLGGMGFLKMCQLLEKVEFFEYELSNSEECRVQYILHTHVYISMYIYIDMIRCIYRICKLDTLYVSLLSTNNL